MATQTGYIDLTAGNAMKAYADAEITSLVRAYGDGVLVCRKGQTTGALVNADGSFDVVGITWSGDVPTADVDNPLMRSDVDGTELRAGGESVAQFGQTARIGREGEAHVEVSDTGMTATDVGGGTVFAVDSSGAVREVTRYAGVRQTETAPIPYSAATTSVALGSYTVPASATLSANGWYVAVNMESSNYMAYMNGSASGTGCTVHVESGGTQGSYPDALWVYVTPSTPSAGATIANATATATLVSSQSGATRGTLTLTLKATCASDGDGGLVVTVTMTSKVTGLNYDPYESMARILAGPLGFRWTHSTYLPYLSFGTLSDSPHGYSSALGEGLVTGREDQVVLGKYNEKSTGALLVVGCGTSESVRQNALVVGASRQVAEGASTATGARSHAEGTSTANGMSSHAEGASTAGGGYAHAEGRETSAAGSASHAQNEGAYATKSAQTALGTYNVADAATSTTHPSGTSAYGKYAVIVGNGTSDTARSNALAVDWAGNVEAAGGVTATGAVSGSSLSSTGALSAASASVTGAVDAGSLTLGTALPVSEGGTGSASVYKSTTVSQVISAASGRTVSSVTYASWGKVAMLSVTCTGFSASTGTQTVGTVVSGKRPVYAVYATAVTSAYAPYAQLATDGALTVYWSTAPSASTGYTIRFVYLLA